VHLYQIILTRPAGAAECLFDAVLRRNRKKPPFKSFDRENQVTPGLVATAPAPRRKEGCKEAFFRGVWFGLKFNLFLKPAEERIDSSYNPS
jgi:hypothetical protein